MKIWGNADQPTKLNLSWQTGFSKDDLLIAVTSMIKTTWPCPLFLCHPHVQHIT